MNPPRTVSVFKLRLQVVVSVVVVAVLFFSAVKILMNKHLIWVFRELVDWFGVFLTSKWTSVLRQRLHVVFLFSALRRNTSSWVTAGNREIRRTSSRKENLWMMLKLR